MNIKLSAIPQTKSLSFISTLVLISFLTIGGCSENNGAGVDTPAPQTSCTTVTNPCTSVTESQGNSTIQCTMLDTSVCAVDLEDVIAQANPDGSKLTGDTTMWIEAWGGTGGASDKGERGGAGGYAITTTTVNDIKAKNSGSSTIYYFLGTGGFEAAERCGGGGGVSTIVTTEDLALNPSSNPTQSAPPILLVAGGGGGGAARNHVGLCTTSTQIVPGGGGSAFATTRADGLGGGQSSEDQGKTPQATGGNQNDLGKGGEAFGLGPGNPKPTNGADGFGGLGGIGGTGPGCTGPGANDFSNTPVPLSMTTGLGGSGGGAKGSCAAGGGGAGGGYGGGGGGSHGNEGSIPVSGAGGGSFAIQSTKSSRLAPTTRQPNPCGAQGCVRITFAP